MLAQDGSTFENMFSLPPPAQVTNDDLVIKGEGDSDDRPIHLQGDSIDEFRDLLWSLYAM